MKKDLQVYAVGGCGLKVAHKHLDVALVKGHAKPSVAVLDTSKSDIDFDISNHQISHHFIEHVDGMGKDRALAFKVISPEIGPFLDKHPPGNVNIVIGSISGGTGSVGILLVLKELLSRGENAIAMIIANNTNEREAINSLSAFNDLNKIAKDVNRPVPFMYYHNTNPSKNGEEQKLAYHANAVPQSVVNKLLQTDYARLCCMLSGDHIGIDSKDVTNFLNYTNVSKTPAKVIELYTTTEEEFFDDLDGKIESMVVLSKDIDYQSPDFKQRYEVKGSWRSEIMDKMRPEDIQDLMFLLLTDKSVPAILKRLKEDRTAFKAAAEAAKVDHFDDFDDEDAEDIGI